MLPGTLNFAQNLKINCVGTTTGKVQSFTCKVICCFSLSPAAGSMKRERSSTEAENSKLKDQLKDLQNHLQSVRKSQEEQNKFHHVMMQTKSELEVRSAQAEIAQFGRETST